MLKSLLRWACLSLSLILLLALVVACDGEKPTIATPDPHAPARPSEPTPSVDAGLQPLGVTLSWFCSDPDDDTLTYDLYFDTTISPNLLAEHLPQSSYHVDGLAKDQRYYWRVIARDPDGHTAGSPSWSFATMGGYVYPLAVGNSWQYDYEFYWDNIRPADAPGVVPSRSSHTYSVDIPQIDTMGDGSEAYVLQAYIDFGTPPSHAGLLQNREDGLYDYGYVISDPFIILFSATNTDPLFNRLAHRGFRSIDKSVAASVSDEQGRTPDRELAYPLKVGTEWIYSVSYDGDLTEVKRVTRRLTIDVPAGEFDCYEIETHHELGSGRQRDESYIAFDYISDQGLVKRVVHILDQEITDYEAPEVSRQGDMHIEMTLTEYNVQ